MNENRISAVIIGFFITLGFSMYGYVSTGTLDTNVQNLLLTFIYIIGGIQVSQHVKDYAMASKQRQPDSSSIEEK